jgi:hypothetical protein
MKLILGTTLSLCFNLDDGTALLQLLSRGTPVSPRYSSEASRLVYTIQPGHGVALEVVSDDQIVVEPKVGTEPA